MNKAQYLTGEDVVLIGGQSCAEAELKLFRLADEVTAKVSCQAGGFIISGLPSGNYGIKIVVGSEEWEDAFDVVVDSRAVVRYGFLSDFSDSDTDTEDVEWMKELHINAIQFYDWMYRHDDLVSQTEQYEDPLGRKMSLSAISDKIKACKEKGIRPFAYGAIYAATEETFRKHPEWGMYTFDGEPMVFADWLHFMNVAPDCGWTDYLMNEYRKSIELGFEGIHMDTYGFPKQVWDVHGKAVELDKVFPDLIDRASDEVKHVNDSAGVIFNAVNNWPVESVAKTTQDSVYIEVWPPHDTFHDLYLLIRNAKLLSGKNVILAAYMKPFMDNDRERAMAAWKLTWAAISAAGGTQLVLGENRGILRDSYYVNYRVVDSTDSVAIKRYCDFQVRYADLLYGDNGQDISDTASCGVNEDICFNAGQERVSCNAESGRIWTIIRSDEHRISVNLINLVGNSSYWNEPKNEPKKVEEIEVRFRCDRKIKGIYSASPDRGSLGAEELPFTCEKTGQGRIYTTKVSNLQYWTVVWLEKE